MAVHERLKIETEGILEAELEGAGWSSRKKIKGARMCMMRARGVRSPRCFTI